MAYYYNMEYELNECFIGIVQLNPDRRFQAEGFFAEKGSISTTAFGIEALKWKNDSVLVIKAYTLADFSSAKKFHYYKLQLLSTL